jgi:glycosyltransferase involved in cell wall biosynthesis
VGDAGKKIDPHDLDALTNALEEVLKKKEVRKQMSQSGQIQAQKFSWKKTTNDILQLFHHISP